VQRKVIETRLATVSLSFLLLLEEGKRTLDRTLGELLASPPALYDGAEARGTID
jgi:hypothetical protein